jgi:outer membrane murein-binding lipoprotein Lpp
MNFMNDKVSKLPIIALIAGAGGALLAFCIAQFDEKKDAQETAVQGLNAQHAETEAVMRKIGEEAAAAERNRATDPNEARRALEVTEALKRLDEKDEAEWQRSHPQSTPNSAPLSHD